MRAALRRATLWAAVAALGVPLLAPALLLGAGPTHALGYSLEYGLTVLAVAAAARTRAAAVVRRAAVALYALLFLFASYERAFAAFFHRAPAIIEDYRLLINLFHFLRQAAATFRFAVLLAVTVIAFAALLVVLARVLGRLQDRARTIPRRNLAVAAAAWTVLGGASAIAGGPIRSEAGAVRDNVRASIAVRERLRALETEGRDDRYQDLMKVRLARKPSFYLLVIEAYGEVLATWDMTGAYRAAMERTQARLEAAGYRMRTAYSAAPVHGGRSWLSLATIQSGIVIDQPETFDLFKANAQRLPTLVGFFRAQGYHTASVEPGTKEQPGISNDDLYAHDLRVDAAKLDYHGPRWGWGEIPDQVTVETFRRRYLPTIAEPRYVFYMAVSTHYPWTAETVPPYDGPRDPPLPGEDAIASDFRREYLEAVAYEWRVLADFLEADREEDIVVVVLGDHQPRLESNQPGEVTFDTPVHVLSRDGAFVDGFADAGFRPGLYAEVDAQKGPPLRHEGLFSLLVTHLADAYGTLETQGLAHYMQSGISLRGLHP